jgi:hypothetical protein
MFETLVTGEDEVLLIYKNHFDPYTVIAVIVGHESSNLTPTLQERINTCNEIRDSLNV